MIYEIGLLKKTLDSVRLAPDLAPQKGKTFCNIAAYRVAEKLGLKLFYSRKAKRIMTANEMTDHMEASPKAFARVKNHLEAWTAAGKGHLVFAALKDDPHGHIAPIYPTAGLEVSGKWQDQVPYASNVGIRNDVMGVNYVFRDPPAYYLVL